MDDNKELKRKIKMLLLMADNDGNKKENHKFLYEFECFREEFDDEDIPEVLREAALNAEIELKIPLEDTSDFKNVSNMEWHDASSKPGAVVRDNDVTIPALEEGMQVMDEEMKKRVRTKRGPSAN